MSLYLEIEGAEELYQALTVFSDFVSTGEIGRVYSKGAIGPHGQRYDHYVMHHAFQAEIHKGWWRTEETRLEEFEPTAVDYAERAVEALVEGGANERAARRFMDFLIEDLFTFTREYDPQRPYSTYVRTNTLFHSWDTEVYI